MTTEFTGRATIRLHHGDCMDALATMHENQYELAIVDPPYGIGAGKMQMGMWGASRLEKKDWDSATPAAEYFEELGRVCERWIVWGGNYFPFVWPTRAYIVWDKGAGFRGRDFAECEMAATSMDRNAKVFSYDPLANGDYRGKIHPTQKPIALYKWLLKNYAKEGDRIIDTHGGSMSIAIACWDMGFDLDLWELDDDYYAAGVERVQKHVNQLQFAF